METGWKNVKKEHVIQAIQEFEKLNEDYPKARNTFLLYEGKEFPAKHIRGMAFKFANKREIKKSEYTGGQETVTFFDKIGFNMLYNGQRILSTVNRESRFAYVDEYEIKVNKKQP